MDFIPFIFLLTFSILLACVISAPQFDPDILDIIENEDDAEIAVPRSPKIQGAQTEYLILPFGYKMENLTCEVTGIPMPKVIWIKDGVGVKQLPQPLKVDFNPESRVSTLLFPDEEEDFSDTTDKSLSWAGNYTCIAANFLGRISKWQIVTFANTTTTLPDADPTLSSTEYPPPTTTMTTTFTTETTVVP